MMIPLKMTCSTDSSSSDSETDNTEATDTEPELSDDSKCELDGISSSLFDERSGSDLSADDESDGDDDDRELAKSELNSKNDDTERTDENTEATELSDSICHTIFLANLMASRRCLMNTGVLNWVTMINAAISMEGMIENR